MSLTHVNRRGLIVPRLLLFGLLVAGMASILLLMSASPARAASPWWRVASSAVPTNLPPGGEGEIVASALNVGDADAGGEEVTISDQLPPGLSIQSVHFYAASFEKLDLAAFCTTTGNSVRCKFPATTFPVHPFERLEAMIYVNVGANASSGEENDMSVEGGGAPRITSHRPITVNPAPTPFGLEGVEVVPENEGGEVDTQAGSHPFQLTSFLALASTIEPGVKFAIVNPPTAPALPRNIRFDLPAGLVGDASAIPQCTVAQFSTFLTFGGKVHNLCPADTAVGIASVTINEPQVFGYHTGRVPVFNITPNAGEPARFGFEIVHAPVFLDTSVRTGADYGVTVNINHIAQTAAFISSQVTLWGVPGDPRHAQSRGWACLNEESECGAQRESKPAPFLTLPTSCGEPLTTSVSVQSWNQPEFLPPYEYTLTNAAGTQVGTNGCNRLSFGPEIKVAPDGQQASKPTGLTVGVHVPQEGQLNPAGLANSNIKDIAVTLPAGVGINPAGADGLEACSESQVGFTGLKELHPVAEAGVETAQLTPKIEFPFCPDASKIATVKIKLPILPNPLEGAVYLAAQNANPFGSLIALYLVAEDPVSGVLLKLPGEVSLSDTGQITTTFLNNPQGPLEDAELHFFGGERAPLATPAHCGTYTTDATFTPWSGDAPVKSSSSFEVLTGPTGAPCPGASLPFAPSLTAGTTNVNAGSFSALTTTISREDGNQDIQSVQLHMPAGLSGILAGVKLCPEAQANAGTCGQESRIGSTVVSVGLGGDPYSVAGGEVFLTEKVAGSPADAPFGLSVVNPAVAGPFNLGKVVVRATIEVDPHTAQLTITTGAIPHILDGIPLQIKHVNVTIDRPGFTFNPTSCGAKAITGSVGSVEGASANVSVPFAVTNCGALKFAPTFSVSTSGKTSKADGASLTATLSYPKAAQGTQTNITRVKVDLPKQLPSRLTTLQKACTNAQFEANPAGCPSASKIGYAKVTTPLLPVPLEGPAIFVSHGGEAFPSLTMVLQGYGVTVDLVGTTFISHAGVTSTTFTTVPDVPFNTFTLTLGEGKYSALGANLPAKAHGSFCGQTLNMPTEFVAQNGAKINESTPISVSGCAKAKPLTRAQKLAKALKACKKDNNKAKRARCDASAKKHYGPLRKSKKKK